MSHHALDPEAQPNHQRRPTEASRDRSSTGTGRRSGFVGSKLAICLLIVSLAAPRGQAQNFCTGQELVNEGDVEGQQVNPTISCHSTSELAALPPDTPPCTVGYSNYTSTGGFDPSYFRHRGVDTGGELRPLLVVPTTIDQYQNQNAAVLATLLLGPAAPTLIAALEVYETGSTNADALLWEGGNEFTGMFTAGQQQDPTCAAYRGLDVGVCAYASSEAPSATVIQGALLCQPFARDAQGDLELGPAGLCSDQCDAPTANPDIALCTPDGGSPVGMAVWESSGCSAGDDDDGFSVQGRVLGADGTPTGTQFQINQASEGFQWKPSVAPQADCSGFLVTWENWALGGGDPGEIVARYYDVDGTPQGDELSVSAPDGLFHTGPAITVLDDGDGDGDWVVSWVRLEPTFNRGDVVARRIAGNGGGLGQTFEVTSDFYPSDVPEAVDIASHGDDYVVAWQGSGCQNGDCSGSSIQMRGTFGCLFADGFESGDDTGWSATSP
ncbi:MAG: hypothetical protein DWQ36_11390 [Acidobacteria bacterium]|nr:MAG: hypothetical protein DWQ30_17360 [Acidobacteriota bacterium]REK07809.1 MAG: hypothetical protein DWQ36_11390 [Acidobacteriota bacterium]